MGQDWENWETYDWGENDDDWEEYWKDDDDDSDFSSWPFAIILALFLGATSEE